MSLATSKLVTPRGLSHEQTSLPPRRRDVAKQNLTMAVASTTTDSSCHLIDESLSLHTHTKHKAMKRVKIESQLRRHKGLLVILIGILLVTFLLETCESLSITRCTGKRQSQQRFMSVSTDVERKVSSSSCGSIQTYEHDGWTLSYRYKPASRGYENDVPLLLIHPVGIGLSSWFYNKFI